jgi:hypothetical protein
MSSYTPNAQSFLAVHPLIGPYAKGVRGWSQDYRSEDGGRFSVTSRLELTPDLAVKFKDLLISLDQLFPTIFDVIDSQPKPFDDFDIDDLELSGIFPRDGGFIVEMDSERCKDQQMTPWVIVSDQNVEFIEWTC